MGLIRSVKKRDKFNLTVCVYVCVFEWKREGIGFCRPWNKAREQMASFVRLY